MSSMRGNGNKERWSRLEPLIDKLVDMPAEARSAFLDDACRGDPEFRREIEELLGFHAGSDGMLDNVFAHSFPDLITDAHPSRDLMNGAYRLEREIGRGGMATVYLASDTRHDRKVAVKILHRSFPAALSADRFLSEIRTMARLRHPHILPLHDSGESDGILFYVMPHVEGGSLRQRLKSGTPMDVPEALRIIREVASAIDAAHRDGIVHRDIKPENILLDDELFALVADFGIALAVKAASTDGAVPARAAGTPHYMSPEQSRGGATIDARSDIYSLGAVAYEMLFGRQLSDRFETEHSIPLKAIAALRRATASRPDERQRTASEFATELESAFSQSRSSSFSAKAGMAVVAAIAVVALVSIPLILSGRSGLHAAPQSLPETRLTRSVRSANVAAYDSYQRGLDQALSRSDSGARLAIRYFEYAISQDSGFAPAYAELAHMYTISAMGRAPTAAYRATALARARASAAKAVSLDDSLPEAHDELAFANMLGAYDLQTAESELKRALELDPVGRRAHEYLSDVYMWTERPADALRETQIASNEDPLAISSQIALAYALYNAGNFDRSLVELEKLRRVNPPIRRVSVILGGINVMRKMYPEAMEDFRGLDNHTAALPDAFFVRTLALAGNRGEARRLLPRLIAASRQGEGAYGVAVVYEGLGDYDNAFLWLNKSIDDHSFWITIMSPMFEKFRADPRFDKIRDRLRHGAQKR